MNLLASETEGILRGVAGLMCELSLDTDGAAALEREGAVPPLTELIHSKNAHVSTYAASTLFNINKVSACGIFFCDHLKLTLITLMSSYPVSNKV